MLDEVKLVLEQMGQMFGRERSVITKHIRNVFADGELDEKKQCAEVAHTTSTGNLDSRGDGEIRNARRCGAR